MRRVPLGASGVDAETSGVQAGQGELLIPMATASCSPTTTINQQTTDYPLGSAWLISMLNWKIASHAYVKYRLVLAVRPLAKLDGWVSG